MKKGDSVGHKREGMAEQGKGEGEGEGEDDEGDRMNNNQFNRKVDSSSISDVKSMRRKGEESEGTDGQDGGYRNSGSGRYDNNDDKNDDKNDDDCNGGYDNVGGSIGGYHREWAASQVDQVHLKK